MGVSCSGSARAIQQLARLPADLSHRQPERRYIREIIFGQRRAVRYYSEVIRNPGEDTGLL